MKVKALVVIIHNGEKYKKGDILEVSKEIGERLVANKKAEKAVNNGRK